MNQPETAPSNIQRKPYRSPTIESKGRVEDLTRWVNSWWSVLLGGGAETWNPWASPGGGS